MDRLLSFSLITLLIFAGYIDIKKKIIPNVVNFLILILAFLTRGILSVDIFFIGASVFVLPIVLIYGYGCDLLNKEILGFGDIKLIIPLGGLLFNSNLSILLQVYLFYLLLFLFATIYIITFFYINKVYKKPKIQNSQIALSPFIILAFFSMHFFIDKIIFCLKDFL